MLDAKTDTLSWRTSSYSGGTCVAIAAVQDVVAVRNSNHPDAGTLTFARPAMAMWVHGVRAGELDDLL